MEKKILAHTERIAIMLKRLCRQVIENHGDFSETVLLGLQPRGIIPAQRIQLELANMIGKNIELGYLDCTFHRDDFRRREQPILPSSTNIPFLIEQKKVILIDDVLFTGRTVRAALDAMITFGRPAKVELLVLIDRKYTRELPIAPHYTGMSIDSVQSQSVLVEWNTAQGDYIWLQSK
jgi:pyrimidine operon attenuation protein/uracil phosphoribosyltransferase